MQAKSRIFDNAVLEPDFLKLAQEFLALGIGHLRAARIFAPVGHVQNLLAVDPDHRGDARGGEADQPGLSQIFAVNALLTIGEEIAAPNIVERTNDSVCHCREAEAPVEG
jgi:hypothetical protein